MMRRLQNVPEQHVTSARRQKAQSASPRVALFALDERLHRAQRSLLKAFGYQVIDCDSFPDLLNLDSNKVDCISVDLYGVGMSPAQCLEKIRGAGLDLSVILLSGELHPAAEWDDDVASSGGGSAYLLLQPVDIELYLTTLRSLTTPS